ncbi:MULTISPECIES: alpha/beta hydrolase-fold protein [unclassified Streptomyces]|uniref:alpha/beta hydrolase n=1 Tax=unclassified Streptomyces TaxID=2593676 RepID=UPI00340D924F
MKRPSTAPVAVLALCSALLVAGCSEGSDPVSFGDQAAKPASRSRAPGNSKVQLPTNPREWSVQRELADGTKVVRTTLKGRKSGFEGKVWAWAPKQYFEEKYKNSAFPVLIALPGSNGYPTNYWYGADLKLQETIAEQARRGRSLPFVVVMPVLNADKKNYYDGSDIPGQPKMGTWMSDDVPDLVRENFRTFKDPRGWGFFGSSSGGYVGMKMMLQYPRRFGAAIAGGPDTRPDSPLWKGHEKEQQANNPEQLAQDLINKGGPTVNLSIMLGTKESGQAKVKDFLAKYGKGPVRTNLYMIQNGHHSGRQYAKSLGDGPLEWISKRMLAPSS